MVSPGFAPTLIPIFGALAAGYLIRKTGLLRPNAARRIMMAVQKFVTPCVLVISFWGLESVRFSLLALPLAGLAVIAFQLAGAAWLSRLLKLEGRAKGSFLIGAVLSNIGYLGWFVNLALFGKTGFDYAFVYGFYFQFAVYTVAYPIAAHYGGDEVFRQKGFWGRILVGGILPIALAAIAIGLSLHGGGVAMPAALSRIHPHLIQVATGALMFAAGLTVSVRSSRRHLVPSLAMCALKLSATPLFVAAALKGIGGLFAPDPLMFDVILVESMMPLAISCLSISAIFHLDQDLTNVMWAASTLLFFPALRLMAVFL